MNWNKISIFVFVFVCQNNLFGMNDDFIRTMREFVQECEERQVRLRLLGPKIKDLMSTRMNCPIEKEFCSLKRQLEDALTDAVRLGCDDSVELLLKEGLNANLEIKSDYSFKSLCTQSRKQSKENLIHLAARKSWFTTIFILVKYGANINSLNENLETPLFMAILTSGDYVMDDTIKTLFKLGANPNLIRENGMVPLASALKMLCAKHPKRFNIVRLLMEHGADLGEFTLNNKFEKLIDCVAEKSDKEEYQKILKDHKKRLENKLLYDTYISSDPIGIILDYLF